MRKNKTLIISVGICLCLVLMVAYAAFQTNLTINGTSSISSNWQVEITKVISKNVNGGAYNESEPVFSPTAVTFKTILMSPGDSIDYEVTINNKGTIDARLNTINKTESENPAIQYAVSGIKENDILKAGESKQFIVTVKYNDTVTTQPDILTSSLTVSLEFVQA